MEGASDRLCCVMQVVVNALIQAIPAIFNVLLVCLVFWLIFSIMGVNLFGGRFRSCVDAAGNVINSSIIAGELECRNKSAEMNVTWKNPLINFDNVLTAYLALFQVVWLSILSPLVAVSFLTVRDCARPALS